MLNGLILYVHLSYTRNFSTVQRGKGTLRYATSWECLHCVFITSININSGVGQTLQKWLISSFLCFQGHFALVCRPICSVKSYIMQYFAINTHLHSCPVQVFEHQSSFLSINMKAKQCNRSPTLRGFHALPFPSTADALSLHQVRAVSEASCVTQEDGEPTEVQSRLHHISGGASNGRHNGCRSLTWNTKCF